MPVKIASTAVVTAALLAAVAANAQVIDLSRTKCRDFIQFPKETMSFLTMWLDGYLTDDEDPRIVDFTKIEGRGGEARPLLRAASENERSQRRRERHG